MMASIKGRSSINALVKLQESLGKLSESERHRWNVETVNELAARLLRKVKRRTLDGVYAKGTDKTGGTLRRGWTVGCVEKHGQVCTVEIFNPVYYAPYVEFGHRTANHKGWVDGRFMLTTSELELQKDAPRIMANKLNSFIGGALS